MFSCAALASQCDERSGGGGGLVEEETRGRETKSNRCCGWAGATVGGSHGPKVRNLNCLVLTAAWIPIRLIFSGPH